MEQLRGVITFISNILKFHKKKLVFVIFSALLFFVLIFPYDDLSDLITSQVAKFTRNQVFVEFENLGVKLFPTIGIKMDEVKLDLPNMPTLKASHMDVTPAITSLIIMKPGFDLNAENLFGGELDLSYRSGKAIEGQDGAYEQDIQLEFENLSLAKIKQFAQLPVKLNGSGNLILEASFDPTFRAKPNGEVKINFKKLVFPSQTIQTQMGPIVAPQLEFSPVEIIGRLANDKLKVEKVILGNNKNPLYGEIKGEIGLRLSKMGPAIDFRPGGYSAEIDINVSKSLEKSGFGSILPLLGSYSQPTNKGLRFHVKMESIRFGPPTKVQKL